MDTIFNGYEVKHVQANSHGKTVLDVAMGEKSIFTCGSDCAIAVWDPADFSCKRRITKLAGWVVKCTLCPLEEHLLACAGDRLYIFNVSTIECRKVCEVSTKQGMVGKPLQAKDYFFLMLCILKILSIAWAPDNSFIAANGRDGAMLLWKARDLTKPQGSECVVYEPYAQFDGKSSADNTEQRVHGHTASIMSIAFSHDSKYAPVHAVLRRS